MWQSIPCVAMLFFSLVTEGLKYVVFFKNFVLTSSFCLPIFSHLLKFMYVTVLRLIPHSSMMFIFITSGIGKELCCSIQIPEEFCNMGPV